MKALVTISCLLLCSFLSFSQKSETPLTDYAWKGSKTTPSSGFVVLKSGKRLDGQISLKGSSSDVKEVIFILGEKKINFPPSALEKYGLSGGQSISSSPSSKVNVNPVSDSPESSYEWLDRGEVMEKKIEVTKTRPGYVVLKNGTKYDGAFKLKRKDGVITDYEVKTSEGKKKGAFQDLSSYGYNLSPEEIEQANIAKLAKNYYPGSVTKGGEVLKGDICNINIQGSFYSKKVVLKDGSGSLSIFGTEDITSFSQKIKGENKTYIVIEDKFIQEDFNGNTFQFYRNPSPTTVNNFATNLAKSAGQITATTISQQAIKKDAEKNNYVTNLDSVLLVSTDAELEELKNTLVGLSGYSSAEEAHEKSDNESLKNTITAIDLELAGRDFATSDDVVVYNREWIILNKKSGEKTVVYQNDFKKLIEPLLKGCYEYLLLEKKDQKKYSNWKEVQSTLKMLDGCY